MTRPAFAAKAWEELAAHDDAEPAAPPFDRDTLHGLPAPARRLLERALPDELPLSPTVTLEMDGEIKLGGHWLTYTAHEILLAGVGFVWAPVVEGGVVHCSGADVLTPAEARMEFRLQGLIPVVRASGPDVRRSAQGRLAAETVAWLPQALTPQMGARWRPVDGERAIVTLAAAGEGIDVEVAVDEAGQISSLGLQRWNGSAEPPGYGSFGGSVAWTLFVSNGVHIAGAGTVGWDWGTAAQHDVEFFRYRITRASFGDASGEWAR